MENERSKFEELLDYVLYAPIGAIERLSKDTPSLIDEGRARVEGRVNTARIIGRFALSTARGRLQRFVFEERAHEDDYREHDHLEHESVDDGPVVPKKERSAADKAVSKATALPIKESDLAIAGYDALSATQIVSRLGGLTRNELAKIRQYEESTRHRRTVLGRIAQLDGSQQEN